MITSSRQSLFHEILQQEDSLEQEKAALQQQLADVEARLRALRIEKASVAPLNLLPDEVLVQILEQLYLHDFPFCIKPSVCTALESPLTISHVSRRWRNIALSLPSIWKCIHVTFGVRKEYHRIVQLYLSRSQSLSLSVSFDIFSGDVHSWFWQEQHLPESQEWAHLWQCWRAVISVANRWRHFVLLLAWDSMLEQFQNVSEELDLSPVQFLQIHVNPGEHSTNYASVFLDPDCTLPQLTHLHLTAAITPLVGGILGNVLELYLDGQGLSRRSLAMISQAATRLQNLFLSAVELEEEREEELAQVVVFPALRFLALFSCDLRGVISIFGAPLLDRLVLDDPQPLEFTWSWPPDVSSYSRFPNLRELQLIDSEITNISPFFTMLIGVTTLRLDQPQQVLLHLMDNPTAFPGLHTLVLPHGCNAEVLVKYAQWKSLRGDPLRAVRFGPSLVSVTEALVDSLRREQIRVEYLAQVDAEFYFWSFDESGPKYPRGFSVVPSSSEIFDAPVISSVPFSTQLKSQRGLQSS